MSRNCIIIHGGPLDAPETDPHQLHTLDWFPWVKSELEKRGVKTVIPPMPHPWNPVYHEYKIEFEKLPVGQDTVLVGHSRGCMFLVRWLGETKRSVKKLVMVAPSFIPSGSNEFKKIFYTFNIDETIKERVEHRVIYTSDTEDEDGKKSAEIVNAKLDCEVVSLKNHGHYTTEDMGSNKFPELVQCVLS